MKKKPWRRNPDKKSFRLMSSNIGLSFHETVPLTCMSVTSSDQRQRQPWSASPGRSSGGNPVPMYRRRPPLHPQQAAAQPRTRGGDGGDQRSSSSLNRHTRSYLDFYLTLPNLFLTGVPLTCRYIELVLSSLYLCNCTTEYPC